MPLLLGLLLVALFIWFAENIGTFARLDLSTQRDGWRMVAIDKLGAWFLLMIISYTLVSLINAPREVQGQECHAAFAVAILCTRCIAVCNWLRCAYAAAAGARTGLATPLRLAGQNALPQRGDASLRLRRDQAVALIVETAELAEASRRTRAKASLIASRHSMTCPMSCSRV